MKVYTIYKYTLAAALLFTSVAFADEKQEEHVQPGSRAATHVEWLKMQQEREDKEESQEASAELAKTEEETTVSLGENASVKAPLNASTYYTSHAGAFYNPISVSFLGDMVTLHDGSVWTVSTSDSYKTLNWLTSDLIILTSNSDWFSSYMFRMTNQNTGVSVKCNMTLGPVYNGLYTYWIVAINYFTQEICLNDGSIWQVSGFDSSIFNNWLLNDTVMIGVNDKFLSSSRPNILINVNTLTFVRANCTY